MPTWFIKRVESLAVWDEHDLSDGYKPLFVDQLSNETNFAATLHEGGTTGVEQDDNEQENYNEYDNANMDEDPYNPTGIELETKSPPRETIRVPQP